MAKEAKETGSVRDWTAKHAGKHVSAAKTYLQKLGQAEDMHDRLHAHAEFVHKHVEMCHERAKALSDVVAAASSFIGACVSVLHVNKNLRDIARKSPTHEKSHEEGRKQHWKTAL
jgi:hypothetical protein